MKTQEFKANYNLDTTAHKPRGVRKQGESSAFALAVTADGKPFNHETVYYFFDGEKVRTSEHLRRIDAENLGSMGLRIVAINELRVSKDDALRDAQQCCLDQIEALRQKVRNFETQKTPKARSLKMILMARDA